MGIKEGLKFKKKRKSKKTSSSNFDGLFEYSVDWEKPKPETRESSSVRPSHDDEIDNRNREPEKLNSDFSKTKLKVPIVNLSYK